MRRERLTKRPAGSHGHGQASKQASRAHEITRHGTRSFATPPSREATTSLEEWLRMGQGVFSGVLLPGVLLPGAFPERKPQRGPGRCIGCCGWGGACGGKVPHGWKKKTSFLAHRVPDSLYACTRGPSSKGMIMAWDETITHSPYIHACQRSLLGALSR